MTIEPKYHHGTWNFEPSVTAGRLWSQRRRFGMDATAMDQALRLLSQGNRRKNICDGDVYGSDYLGTICGFKARMRIHSPC